jgi:hypothetical protein
MNIVGDEFPIMNYMKRVLEFIPAGVDDDENADLISFVFWMLNKEGSVKEFGFDFLAVFVRLFWKSESELKDSSIDEDVLHALRLVFRRLVCTIPGGSDYCLGLCRKNQTRIELIRRALTI